MERRNGREPWIRTLPTHTIRDSAPSPADTAAILNTINSSSSSNHSISLINNRQDGHSRARDRPRRGEILGGHLRMLLARDTLRKELILLQMLTPIDPSLLSLNLVPKCINNPQAHISNSSQPQTNFAIPPTHSNRSNQGQLHKGGWFLIATRIDQCP